MDWKLRAVLDKVKEHAQRHVEESDWLYVVQCMTDSEIASVISKARTVSGALRRVARVAAGWGIPT